VVIETKTNYTAIVVGAVALLAGIAGIGYMQQKNRELEKLRTDLGTTQDTIRTRNRQIRDLQEAHNADNALIIQKDEAIQSLHEQIRRLTAHDNP
jgi:uncharacterized protein HemX